MQDKKIAVVTGATGFVGSHLVDLLLRNNYEVRCLTRKSSNLRWLKGKEVKIIDSGLFDRAGLEKAIEGADYFYHVAGVVRSKTKSGFYKGNVDTTKNILDIISEKNKNIERVIIVSSLTACGPAEDDKPCTEDTIPHPITTYGKSKLAEEEVAKSYMNKIPITICRAPAIYGERESDIYAMFKSFKMGIMTLVGFNKKKLSLIHGRDFVNGIYQASLSEIAKNQIYFISSDEIYDWDMVSDAMEKAMGNKAFRIRIPHFLIYLIGAISHFFNYFSSKPATFNLEKARDFVQTNWTCDTSKARNDFGYRQQISLEDGMKSTVEWYRAHKWL